MSELKQEQKVTSGETEVVVETKATEEKPKLVNEQVESIGSEVKKPGIEGITVEEVAETDESGCFPVGDHCAGNFMLDPGERKTSDRPPQEGARDPACANHVGDAA